MKERLVGAAVLIAIAVWLIPWVLDGPEAPLETNGSSLQLPAAEEPMPMRTQTLRLGEQSEPAAATAAAPPPAEADATPAPQPPQAEPPAETATSKPDEPVVVARSEPAPERPAPAATSSPPAAAPPKPAPAAAAPAGDWAVQLGVFGDQANARRLAQRVQTFGHKADVTSYRDGSRTLHRVRVAARTRAEADAIASALKAHQLDARVVAAR